MTPPIESTKPGPKVVPPNKPSMGELIEKMGHMTHGSTALTVASIIDYDLQRCIQCKFIKLNSETRNRLFRGNGPLSHFSARIDIAYALDITSDRIHRELHKIRDIRNAFAHTKSFLNFDEEPIKGLFEKLSIDAKGIDPDEQDIPFHRFMGHALAIDRYLEAFLVRMGVNEEIYGLKPSKFDF